MIAYVLTWCSVNTCCSRTKSFVVTLSLIDIVIEVNSLAFSVVADDLVLADTTCMHM